VELLDGDMATWKAETLKFTVISEYFSMATRALWEGKWNLLHGNQGIMGR